MTEPNATPPPPRRVRVVSPRSSAARAAAHRPVRREIDEQTIVGEVYMRSLVRLQLQLAIAKPLAPVALIVGLSQVSLPFKGGELVPSPDVALVGFTTDASGALLLQARWPAGLPAGFAVWMQAWIADASGPMGYAASNGVGAKVAP